MNITLMTWNVENLFRPKPGGEAAYAAKLGGLGRVINQHQPDVVALQEIGSPEALSDLITELGGNWHYYVSKFPDERGIRVGFIARHEIIDPEDIVELPAQLTPLRVDDASKTITRAGRGAVAASMTVGDTTIRLVTAHLKSKLISYPGERFQPRDENERARYAAYALNRRAAEAAMVRIYCNEYLANQGQSRPLVLLGDMNDEPQAATTQILVGPGGSEIGSRGELAEDRGDGSRLFNVEPLLPENERRTRVYRGRGEIVDHILVSRALLESIERNSVRAPAVELPSVADDPTKRPPEEASDHAPLLMTLTL